MRWAGVLGGLSLSIVAGCVAAPRLRGPMPVRNQHPAQLTVLHLPPAPAAVLPAGEVAARVDAAYSSLWLSGQGTGGRSWRMDGEYLRLGLGTRIGLGAALELGVELPLAHSSGGFLDGFVIDYHDTLGLPDQNRTTSERNDFDIEARQNGSTVWAVEPAALELLDVPLSLTWQVADPARGLGLALRGGLELPTGADRRGYGNGELDVSLGALLEHHALGLGFFGHLQHTWAGTPAQSRDRGFHFADVTSAGITIEAPLDDGVAALLQVEWETSTLRELGLQVTDRDQWLLWGGLRVAVGRGWQLELGFGEDLQGLASPDFTAWLAMAWNPAAGRASAP
jgi:hypothetical protein